MLPHEFFRWGNTTLITFVVCMMALLAGSTPLNAQSAFAVAATDTTICAGNEVKLYAVGGTDFIWKNANGDVVATDINQITVTPSITTTYFLMGTLNGVMQSASLTIVVLPYPVITNSPNDIIYNCSNELVEVTYTLAEAFTGYQIQTVGASYSNDIQSGTQLTYKVQPNIGTSQVVTTFYGANGCLVRDTFLILQPPNCDGDTTIIIVVPPDVSTDTCLNTIINNFPNPVDTAYICETNPNVDIVINDSTSCITIIPHDNFLGTDTVCVVHCDLINPTDCDTTIIIIIVIPPDAPEVDTVYINVPGNMGATQVCLTEVLSFGDAVGSTGVCGTPSENFNVTTYTGLPCVSILPNQNFVGTDTLCVVMCNTIEPFVCDTTYIIVTVDSNNGGGTPGSQVDTVSVTIPPIIPTEVCLGETLDLTGPILTINVCEDNANTVDVVLNEMTGCVTLDPADNFIGTDTVCIIFCDNATPQVCDTTYIIVTILPTTPTDIDTVYVSIPSEGIAQICLDSTIQLSGPPTLAFLCASDENVDITDGSTINCVNLNPADGFIGTDTLCYVFCDSGVPQVCDTTYIIVTVIQALDTFIVVGPPIVPSDTCLVNILSGGQVSYWTFCDSTEVNLFNFDIDTSGCVSINPPDTTYGGIIDTLCIVVCDTTVVPINCDSIIIIVVIPPITQPNDTVYTQIQTYGTTTYCFDGVVSLPDTITNTYICGEDISAVDISVIQDSLSCVLLTPAQGFVGIDTACVMFCDETGPLPNCEVTYIIITVLPPADTLHITIPYHSTDTICFDSTVLEFPADVVTANFCGLGNPNTVGVTTLFGLDCIIVQAAEGFYGVSEDTVCVINCYSSSNTICDTTYIIFTVESPCIPLFPEDNVVFNEENCDNGTVSFCTNIPAANITNYQILLNDEPFTGSATTCNDSLIALTLPEGVHHLVVRDLTVGCTDSATVIVACQLLQIDTTVTIGTSDTICLSDYGINGPFTSITNTCPEGSGTNVNFAIDTITGCIIYEGLTIGTDTACLEVCLSPNVCVPILVIVTAVPDCFSFIVQENVTVLTNDCNGLSPACIDFAFVQASVYTVTANGSPITPTACNNGAGTSFDLPIGQTQLIFTHITTGCADTVSAFISCLGPEIVIDTINVGEVDTFCVDTSQLLGNFVSLTNICPEESGENVLFTIIPNTNCVIFEGLTSGVDTACLVACDDLGFCDTTYFIVFVNDTLTPPGNPPLAFPDVDTTSMNDTLRVCILANDILNADSVSIFIISQPLNGQVFLNPNDSCLTYVPALDYCDNNLPDSFTYAICNDVGCDTTMVLINIPCDTVPPTPTEFTIYNGFSPNGDGTNNYFHIDGIEEFPDNELLIYNRWGNQVHHAKPYHNDWDGKWDGKDLPDGTYFYYLRLNHDRYPKPFKGWLQIHR